MITIEQALENARKEPGFKEIKLHIWITEKSEGVVEGIMATDGFGDVPKEVHALSLAMIQKYIDSKMVQLDASKLKQADPFFAS